MTDLFDNDEPELFDYKPPVPQLLTEPRAHHGVETSEAAAESMRACSGPMQRMILAYAIRRDEDGITYDEVCVDLDMEKPTSAGRINDLTRGGFLEATGKKRATRSGRSAKVYKATDLGKRLNEQQG